MKVHHAGFAWAGAALFAAAISYFLFAYSVTFGEITSGAFAPQNAWTDVALFSVFALHHSVFARDRVRQWVRQHVPPNLERSFYVWVASLMLIAVCAGWQALPGALWQQTGRWQWIFPVLQVAGLWVTLRSAAIIDVWELAGVRQLSTPNSQLPTPNSQLPTPKSFKTGSTFEPHWELGVGRWEFKTEGPYGWVRHPIYLGWMLIVFGVATMTMTRLVFALVSSAYILVAIPLEERSLRVNSAGAYDDYMRRVRWKLVPYFY